MAHDDSNLVSYLTLRRVVGALGVALPVVVAVWGFFLKGDVAIESSISSYYALRTRDAFVGILFTIAWFLFTYRGYDDRDDIAGNLACVFALGVALFPNSGTGFEKAVHFTAAALLFLVLAYFSIHLFTQTGGFVTPEKRIRNRIYRACGWIMIAAVVTIGIYSLALDHTPLAALQPVFWLEALALWAFGVSWFVKGETLFRDAADHAPQVQVAGGANAG
jgi:hypothetical protein